MLHFGHNYAKRQTMQFILFTQISGLLLFVAIIGLWMFNAYASHHATFDYVELLKHKLPFDMQMIIFSGFTLAFLVKLPALPFHTWIPGVLTNVPVSALLIGVMVKTGAYGLLRFVLPLFPDICEFFAMPMMILGVITLIYGAVVAFGQKNVFKLLAYSTVSHMGLVLAGIFTDDKMALQGVVVLLVTGALSTGALLVLMAYLKTIEPHVDLKHPTALFTQVRKGGVIGLMLTMASIGVPGFGNFVGEMMVVVGLFHISPWIAAIATCGILLSAIYSLWLIQQVFFGSRESHLPAKDISFFPTSAFAIIILTLLSIGLYPASILQILDERWLQHEGSIQLDVSSETENSQDIAPQEEKP